VGWFLLALGILAALLIFPSKIQVLLKGIYHVFVVDVAATPDGVRAIYEEKIDKMQDAYNRSSDALRAVAGQLDTATRKKADLQKRLASAEANAAKFAQQGNWENAQLYAQERDLLMEEIEAVTETVAALQPMLEEIQNIHNIHEQNLNRLKREKEITIANLERDIMTKEMYDQLDHLRRTTNLDKLYGAVQDGAKRKREIAVGARVEHENKLSTKLAKADAEAKAMSRSSYLDELKSKYGKKA
jgi:Skp family chaperone for outer membrane proteins